MIRTTYAIYREYNPGVLFFIMYINPDYNIKDAWKIVLAWFLKGWDYIQEWDYIQAHTVSASIFESITYISRQTKLEYSYFAIENCS